MKNKIGDTKTFLYIEICLYTDLEFEILLTTSMLNKVSLLKVSKSQNTFMKPSFFPKNERNIARISALNVRAEILAIFRSFFGKNDGFKKVF